MKTQLKLPFKEWKKRMGASPPKWTGSVLVVGKGLTAEIKNILVSDTLPWPHLWQC